MPIRRVSPLPLCTPLLLSTVFAIQPAIHAQVLTAQYDNARTGATLHERILKPSNVNPRSFGKLYSRTVDGDVFAQPLYLPSLPIPGLGRRSVVFAATEHDSVYAFDANGTRDTPLWKTTFLDPAHDITPLSDRDVSCPFITPELGITPTPVHDPATHTLYVLARTREHGTFWVVSTKEWDETHLDRPAVLHAYDATNISRELYSSEQNSARDRAGNTVRFAIPTIADGRVFLGTRGHLEVYGLLNPGTHP